MANRSKLWEKYTDGVENKASVVSFPYIISKYKRNSSYVEESRNKRLWIGEKTKWKPCSFDSSNVNRKAITNTTLNARPMRIIKAAFALAASSSTSSIIFSPLRVHSTTYCTTLSLDLYLNTDLCIINPEQLHI